MSIINFPAKTICLITAFSTLGILSAQAQTFSGTSSGTFIDPVGGPDNLHPVDTGIGSSSITFGSGEPDVLTFTGDSLASVPAETLFSVGSLYYYNGATSGGSTLDSVTLDIKLAFTTPFGVTESFPFPLAITTTPNTANARDSADYITLPSSSSTIFTVGAATYTLKLDFDSFTGGGFLSNGTFRVYEGESATANVQGLITTDISSAPDSNSTMLLLIGATGLLCWLRRSKTTRSAGI